MDVVGDKTTRGTRKKLWATLWAEAAQVVQQEPALAGLVENVVLAHDDFGKALAALLARKLANREMSAERLEALVREAEADDPSVISTAIDDFVAILARDPAATSHLTPFLYFKGYHALQWHRTAHWLWNHNRRPLALFLQSRVSEALGVDIHPAVSVGRGVFIDHATAVVIGETAVIGDDVSILQCVTLGGTGKEHGDRHPKVRDGVLIAAGAKILGNIEIGRLAKIGAGSVVLNDVPPRATVAGVPARVVGFCRGVVPALEMDQSLPEPDYII